MKDRPQSRPLTDDERRILQAELDSTNGPS